MILLHYDNYIYIMSSKRIPIKSSPEKGFPFPIPIFGERKIQEKSTDLFKLNGFMVNGRELGLPSFQEPILL